MRLHIFLLCILSLLLFSCTLKKEEPARPPVQQLLKKVPFAPRADSSITVDQMRKWLSCNQRLDSLSYVYLDSFKTEDSEQRLKYQQSFITAQDTICVQQGLTGGYEEYVYILRNSGNKKNRKILESLNLTTY